MRKFVRQSTVFACLAAGLGAAGMAQATNGYFSHGYGTTSKGLAGAGVALSQDSLAAATNPAGMVTVGDRIDFGAALFAPRRQYSVSGDPSGFPGTFGLDPGTVKSKSEYFLVPHFGWNRMLDAQSSIGVSVYGNGGMNTDYRDGSIMGGMVDGTFGDGTTGVDLMQLFIAPTYARKINENATWGITPVIAYQRFEAKGLAMFGEAGGMGFDVSRDDGKLTGNGHDSSWGYGLRLGIQGEVSPGVRLGAAYQTKMYMGKFDDYSGLFAEKGGFDIPANMTVGLAWDVTPTSTLFFDIQHIWYSDIKSIGNRLSKLTDDGNLLGESDGPGFGWRDMTIYKVGYQWQTSSDWTWRLGYSYGRQPIPSSEVLFNILAPGVIEHHLTFGFTRNIGANNEFNFAAMYAPETKVSGGNPFDAPDQQKIELKMHQFEIEASYAWKF